MFNYTLSAFPALRAFGWMAFICGCDPESELIFRRGNPRIPRLATGFGGRKAARRAAVPEVA